ncbi:hypothetical protein SCALIN_C25_0015 [Candidatus Scalindua japonica]|uniref:Uncharacterized protein n=1 Tax=Candidatus Scalindua japonica TaxID=1284222 RepID=A0A286U0D8_9BACT|nr:hypothetical protein SCALIN_C25_0015 [Candidatus Scalindua japonica]
MYNNGRKLICELAEKQEMFIDTEKYLSKDRSKDIIKLTFEFPMHKFKVEANALLI